MYHVDDLKEYFQKKTLEYICFEYLQLLEIQKKPSIQENPEGY